MDLQFSPSNSFQSKHHRAFEASNVKTVAKDENSADDNMEHREGIEPSNTGFADQRVSHFATGAHRFTGSLASQGRPQRLPTLPGRQGLFLPGTSFPLAALLRRHWCVCVRLPP